MKSLAATAALAVDNASLYGATRRAEADQRQLNDELRATVHINELFVAVLAHDLRSPLAAMLTAAELIQSREPAGIDTWHRRFVFHLQHADRAARHDHAGHQRQRRDDQHVDRVAVVRERLAARSRSCTGSASTCVMKRSTKIAPRLLVDLVLDRDRRSSGSR